jgi:putative membrane protein
MKPDRLALLALLTLFSLACATASDVDTTSGGMTWTNGDVAGLVRVANQGEVDQGQLATTKASSSAVRDFAQMMVTDHTAALGRVDSMAADRNLTLAENAVAAELRTASETTVRNLGTYSGAAFDRTYMRQQIDIHNWVLDTIDRVLLVAARDRALREELQTMRASVAAHLQRANEIAGTL